MHRFYHDHSPLSLNQTIQLDAAQSHQLARVLRAKLGDELEVFNDSVGYVARITALSPKTTSLILLEKRADAPSKTVEIILGFALPKGQKLDWILQKGTEIGVTRFVPLITAHTERSHFNDQRAHRIVIEATEQCGGFRPPAIDLPVDLEKGLKRIPKPGVIAWEGERETSLHQVLKKTGNKSPQSFAVLVGPEGGWRQSEIELAIQHGITPVHLGERILRTETAAIVLPALVAFALGQLAMPPHSAPL